MDKISEVEEDQRNWSCGLLRDGANHEMRNLVTGRASEGKHMVIFESYVSPIHEFVHVSFGKELIRLRSRNLFEIKLPLLSLPGGDPSQYYFTF